jgi:putative ABC transport system permease protein
MAAVTRDHIVSRAEPWLLPARVGKNKSKREVVLGESCLLAILGGSLGLGLALLLTSRGDPTGGMLPLFFFPGGDVLIGLGISLVLGLATGILPAVQAMRLQVVEALRRM